MFCLYFDKFFDICNTRTIDEGERKKKPNLKPFYEKEDQRLKVRNAMWDFIDHYSDSGWRALCCSTWKTGNMGDRDSINAKGRKTLLFTSKSNNKRHQNLWLELMRLLYFSVLFQHINYPKWSGFCCPMIKKSLF